MSNAHVMWCASDLKPVAVVPPWSWANWPFAEFLVCHLLENESWKMKKRNGWEKKWNMDQTEYTITSYKTKERTERQKQITEPESVIYFITPKRNAFRWSIWAFQFLCMPFIHGVDVIKLRRCSVRSFTHSLLLLFTYSLYRHTLRYPAYGYMYTLDVFTVAHRWAR